ncbi:glycosyltransferase family 2 protein [Parafilimonas sp.]|uniref:glycosyltransferase family 2 protein n=1 Tax=Parafilimonas sp. TaxID=1969739 RepID=UPI0039E3AB2D
MTIKPLISIITINYNNADITADLLRSILCLQYANTEVIVVDNASGENPSEKLKSVLPSVKIILSDKNLGFAGGNNLGIKQAKGDYLFFVNNDTELTPTILEGLLEIFHNYPDAGVASPKFHYYYAPGTIEFAGYNAVNTFTARNSMVGCRTKDEGQYDAISKTNYGHGGGMMVSRRVIDEVGLMPEVYFLYYEEFDWCEQIKKKGFNIYYQYKSLIYHKESMSVGKTSTLKTFYLNRNRILFMRRNVKGISFLGFAFYYTFFTLPKNTLGFLLKKETDHLKAFWKGIKWNLSNRNLKKIELCAE